MVEAESIAMEAVEAQEFKKKSVSGAVSYTVRSLLLQGMGMATNLVLAAFLPIEAFGVYGLVTQLVSLLQFFSDVGLGPTLIQKKENPSIEEYRFVFSMQLLLSLGIFACTGLLAYSGLLLPKIGPEGVWLMLAMGVSFPLSTLKVIPAIMIERRLDFSKLVIPTIFEQVAYNLLLVWMALNGAGLMAYTYAVVLRALVGVIAMYYLQSWPIGWHFDKKMFRKIIGTGAKFQVSDLLAKIKDQIFYIVLGFWLPIREYGYISWAKGWSQTPYNLTVQNVIAITFPAYSRLQHDKRRLQLAIEKTLFFITLSIFPVLIGMSIFIIPLTSLIEKYHKWQPVLLTFILFTLSIGWAAISTPLTNTLNAIGQINTTLKLMVMWTVLTWVLTPLAIKFFGFNGVAIAAMAISFTSLAPMYYVQRFVKVEIWESCWRQLVAAGAMAVVGVMGLASWQRDFSWMILGMLLTGSTYLVVFLLIGRKKLVAEVRSLRSR